jgi:hypothetical protein
VESILWMSRVSLWNDAQVAQVAIRLDGSPGKVHQDSRGCFAHNQVSANLLVESAMEPCDANVVRAW